MIGHFLVDCLNPVTVFHWFLKCFVLEWRQLYDGKKVCDSDLKEKWICWNFVTNGENCYGSLQFVECGIWQGGIKVIKGVVTVPVF